MKKIILILISLLVLTGCADSVTFQEAMTKSTVGFWYGLWHGMIIGWAWFISLFNDSTAIYAIYNNGGWYDFGFVLGCAMFGGSAYIENK